MYKKEFSDIDELRYAIKDYDMKIIQLNHSLHNAHIVSSNIYDINIQLFTLGCSSEREGGTAEDYYSFVINKPINKEIHNGVQLRDISFFITEPMKEFNAFGSDGHISLSITVPKNIIHNKFGKLSTKIYSSNHKLLLDTFYSFIYKVLHIKIQSQYEEEYFHELILEKLGILLFDLIDLKIGKNHYYDKFKDISIFMKNNYKENISIKKISKQFNITDRTIRNIFMQEIGISPKQYQKAIIMNKLKDAIRKTPENTISELLNNTGLHNQSMAIHDFRRLFNNTPYEYKKTLVTR